MPNWCDDRLILKGNVKDIKDLINKYFTNNTIDFEKIIPEPKTEKDCPSQYIVKKEENRHIIPDEGREWFDWYGFHLIEWGTKWIVNDRYIIKRKDIIKLEEACGKEEIKIDYYFMTAWSPCIKIIEKLIELYPDLDITFAYYEGGEGFAGILDSNGTDFMTTKNKEVRKIKRDYNFDWEGEEDDET